LIFLLFLLQALPDPGLDNIWVDGRGAAGDGSGLGDISGGELGADLCQIANYVFLFFIIILFLIV